MAASPPVAALPWYDRRDYPALLKLFSDPDKLPATYGAWLERAEGVELQFKRAGFSVARIWVRPAPFATWCKGAERFSRSGGAPDFRKRGRATSAFPALTYNGCSRSGVKCFFDHLGRPRGSSW